MELGGDYNLKMLFFNDLIVHFKNKYGSVKGSRKKKFFFLVVRPLRRGGGVRARPLRKKDFFENIFIYFSTKILEKIFLSQNPFPAILRRNKKKPFWSDHY